MFIVVYNKIVDKNDPVLYYTLAYTGVNQGGTTMQQPNIDATRKPPSLPGVVEIRLGHSAHGESQETETNSHFCFPLFTRPPCARMITNDEMAQAPPPISKRHDDPVALERFLDSLPDGAD